MPGARTVLPVERDNVSFAIGFQTHIGRVREVNEDSYAVFRSQELADELDALLVVADGMGGGRGGDVASRIVAETVPETVQEFLFEQSGSKGRLNVERILRDSIERANARIWMRQTERKELQGMGTTCVAAALKGETLTIGHAGDSRAYLLREGQLRQITDDHSEVWQQVLAGQMTREEAARSKFRNRVLKAVGLGQNGVDPDVLQVPLHSGDSILLCTDGLTTELNDAEIARILASASGTQEACNELVEAALHKGGSDNITVVVLRYGKFTPLTSATVAPHSRPARVSETEEETTDPNPSWKASPRPERTAVRPSAAAVFEEEDTDTEDNSEEEAPPPRRRRERSGEEGGNQYAERETARGGSSITAALLVILLLLCIAEGIALFIASTNRTVTAPKMPDKTELGVKLTPETELFNKDFIYSNIKTLYNKPLRPDFLIVEPYDSVVVMTPQGKLLRVMDDGKSYDIPGPSVPLPKPPTGQNAKPTSHVFVTLDAGGNRYQCEPGRRGVQKYDVKGTRVSQDITEAAAAYPTAIGIHKLGHLYVIDEGHLKRLEAFPDPMGLAPSETP